MHAAPTIIIALFANKTDLPWQVDRAAGAAFAAEHSFLYEEVSAKTGENVAAAFERLVSCIPAASSTESAAQLTGGQSVQRSGCCA